MENLCNCARAPPCPSGSRFLCCSSALRPCWLSPRNQRNFDGMEGWRNRVSSSGGAKTAFKAHRTIMIADPFDVRMVKNAFSAMISLQLNTMVSGVGLGMVRRICFGARRKPNRLLGSSASVTITSSRRAPALGVTIQKEDSDTAALTFWLCEFRWTIFA